VVSSGVVVADSYNHRLKIVDVAGSSIKTIGGNGKPGYRDGKGKYVAFFGGLDSRMCTPDPSLTYQFCVVMYPSPCWPCVLLVACCLLAGSGVQFWEPGGLATSADGKVVYVADTNNNAIRTLDLATNEVR
jgi:DNA-binding beta-propeller fold protein YncE